MAAATKVRAEQITVVTVEPQTAYDIAVERIVAETGCRVKRAKAMLTWLNGLLDRARRSHNGVAFPTDQEMGGRNYQLFDRIMDHGAVAAVGSAHEALQTALLNPGNGELTITHDQMNEFGQRAKPGQALYCTVQIGVGIFG